LCVFFVCLIGPIHLKLIAMVHVPVQVSTATDEGFSLEMSEMGGVPTLTLRVQQTFKISVPELLQTLASSTGIASGPGPREESQGDTAAKISKQRKAAEHPIMPFRNSPSYSDYVAIHNWSGPPSANTLVLNDEKASVFSEAKFEPLPVPPKIEFTYAKFKEKDPKESGKTSGSLNLKQPPSYPAPGPPKKAPPGAVAGPPPGLSPPGPRTTAAGGPVAYKAPPAASIGPTQ